MKLRLATEEDSDDLIKFYDETPVTTPISIKLHKLDSFFSQYKMQSNDYQSYILIDEQNNNTIKALVTILFRPALIEGKLQDVGYVTDLRVSPERKVVLEWAHTLLPTLQKAKRERNCKYIFTVVAQGQNQAMNAFIRPRNVRRELPRYFLYKNFDIVNLHGMWPWATPPLSSVITERATSKDKKALTEYITKKSRDKIPNYNPSNKHVLNNIDQWSHLELNNFILAKDTNGTIVGCTALWNSIEQEQFIPVKYDSKSLTLKEALHFFSYFGITRRLTNVGSPLKFYYLSYLLADNTDIFYSLCYQAYSFVPKTHFLMYPHFEGDLMSQPAKSFITSSVKAGLYCVLDPEDPVPDFLKPRVLSEAPDFDLAFI